jgi:hypothetical protein
MVLDRRHLRVTRMATGDLMATPGQLVEAMATALGIPSPTVTQYDRVLAENGLRTTGGRGLSAARVTAADSANLLLAIMGAPISGAAIGDAALICKLYGTLVQVPAEKQIRFTSYWLRKLASLPTGHSLREALVALIEGAIRDPQQRRPTDSSELPRDPIYGMAPYTYLRIRLDGPQPRARIFLASKRLRDPYPERTMTYERTSAPRGRDSMATGDLCQSGEVTAKTIERIAATLKG